MSSDHEQADVRSSGENKPTPATRSGGTGTLLFFLILAVGVGLLTLLVWFAPTWFGEDDLESYPTLGSLSLTPVLPKDGDVSLADLKGKVVLVNFWGTWCPPCVAEFPDIVALEKEYRDRDDFRVLAVSCGRGADAAPEMDELREYTQAFIERRFVEMPVYLDPDQKTRNAVLEVVPPRMLQSEGGMNMPTTLLLDREHRIRVVWVGAQKKEAFAKKIKKLLDET
jgi:thiol-disulfide isomerase/thioredoxin